MPSKPKAYIAGVGYAPAKHGISSLVSAATKALLDAGLTFDDITQGVQSKLLKDGSKAFEAFDPRGIPIDEVENGSELEGSFQHVREQGAQCVLLIAMEKSAAIALVIVSDNILWSRPYLKDSSALITQSNASQSRSEAQASQGLYDICQMVWALRGWSQSQAKSTKEGRLHYKGSSSSNFELSRADATEIPEWKDVEHKPDGKHRLGYNPAKETHDISREDFETVRAGGIKHGEGDEWTQFERKGGDRASLARL